jgi:hypothetical protein
MIVASVLARRLQSVGHSGRKSAPSFALSTSNLSLQPCRSQSPCRLELMSKREARALRAPADLIRC